MADDEPPPPELVVFTVLGKVRRHVVVGGVFLAVVIGDAGLSDRCTFHPPRLPVPPTTRP
jgi:hypothetical protein